MPMFDQGSDVNHDKFISATLLNAQTTANTTWEWLDVRAFNGPASVDVTGIGTGTVDFRGSNSDAQPANDDAGHIIGVAVTANGLTAILIACRWIAVRKTVTGDSTATTALLHKAGQGK